MAQVLRHRQPCLLVALLAISCLLYTSDAADDTPCVDLGGRRIIKKKKKINFIQHINYNIIFLFY